MLRHVGHDAFPQHVKLLGSVVLGSGVLGLIGAGAFGFVLPAIGAASGDPIASEVLYAIGLAGAGVAGTASLVSLLAGVGLLRRARWGRPLGLVDAAIGLVWFPIGTILGVYAIWVLMQAEAVPYFEGESSTFGGSVTSP